MVVIREYTSGSHAATSYSGDGSGLTGISLNNTGPDLAEANYVVVYDSSGFISSEQYLSNTRGGTGLNSSAFTGVIRTDSGVWSTALVANADLDDDIARSKLLAGTANHVVINNGTGLLSSENYLSPVRGGFGRSLAASANGSYVLGLNVVAGVPTTVDIGYSSNATADTIALRDESGNAAFAGIISPLIGDVTTITNLNGTDLTIDTQGEKMILTMQEHQMYHESSSELTGERLIAADTTDAVTAVIASSFVFTEDSAYSFKVSVNATNAAKTGMAHYSFTVLASVTDVGGTPVFTLSNRAQEAVITDGIFDALPLNAISFANVGATVNMRINGLAANAIRWFGKVSYVKASF